MKRLLDICIAVVGLSILSPLLIVILIMIWLQDHHNPFYIAPRVGKNEKPFKMVKLRSMIMNADRSGVDSTSANDSRITFIGRFVRKFKLDEISQLWNVLIGDMSLVGPRPNVERETNRYTAVEKRLLSVQPGITDIASIVFSDEGEILKESDDPDLDYNKLIRPWKSRLGLIYIDNRSMWLDLKIIFLTAIAVFSRKYALLGVGTLLTKVGAANDILRVARRTETLEPHPPPGSDTVVSSL